MYTNKIIRLLFACLLLLLANNALAANWVKKIRSNSLADKLQIVIDLEQDPTFKVFALSKPIRLVIDVQGRPVVDFTNELDFKNRGVSKVRTGMSEDDKVRIVLDLDQDFAWKAYEMQPDGRRGHRVVVDVFDYPNKRRPAQAKKTAKAANHPIAIKTGTSVTDRQLVLESVSGAPKTLPVTLEKNNTVTTVKPAKFVPVVKEAAEVLDIEDLPTAKTLPIVAEPTVDKTTLLASIDKSQTGKADGKVASIKPLDTPKISTLKTLDDIEFSSKKTKKETITASTTTITPTPKKPSSSGKDLLVMIDPGHGGKDSGAVGKAGTYEKHIVLQIAKRLKKRIDGIDGMRAVLTRNRDKYVTLRGRLALANKLKPDLFVSIHADAAQNRSAKGASVFILSNSGASSKTAKWIAQRENAVDSKYGSDSGDFSSDVSNVLLGMQQDITIEGSHRLANKTLKRLKRIGKVHKRRVERAGFAVLKSPSIPSMLVETAFISNPDEERKLKTSSHQKKIVEAVAKGIEEYFKSQGQL